MRLLNTKIHSWVAVVVVVDFHEQLKLTKSNYVQRQSLFPPTKKIKLQIGAFFYTVGQLMKLKFVELALDPFKIPLDH